jgi:gallate decarboxylase subunit D
MNLASRTRPATRRLGRPQLRERRSEKGAVSVTPDCPAAEWPGCRCFPFGVGKGRHRVWGTALLTDASLSVNLLGGEVPHIGAVAVGIPRASLARPARQSATTSVFALVGHKEDELARSMATELARRLGITAVVVAGVHVERARPGDIAMVMRNAGRALDVILARVRSDTRQKRRG